MKNLRSILWGIVLVIVGILLALRSLDVINFDIFFDGWWTLFIIIPCFIDLFKEDGKMGNFIGLLIGIVLLLACNDILPIEYVWKLIVPVVIILIGISCIFKNFLMNKVSEKVSAINSDKEYSATFSSQKINFKDEKFEGCEVSVVFGGAELDLRDAIIEKDVVINLSSIFGGIDVFVPSNCKVKVTSNSMFGGVDNKIKNPHITDKSKTIYINASCVFGGVEVK